MYRTDTRCLRLGLMLPVRSVETNNGIDILAYSPQKLRQERCLCAHSQIRTPKITNTRCILFVYSNTITNNSRIAGIFAKTISSHCPSAIVLVKLSVSC